MKKIIIIIFILLSRNCFPQDFQLSMYETAPLFLNPAMTGLMETKMRAHLHFRNQWNVLTYKPFTTALASFDVPKDKWGFGGQIINMRAGLGNYNVLQLLGSASYAVSFDQDKQHNLSLGLQAGFNQKRLEYGLLTFDSQWTTANGGTFDNSLASGENYQSQVQFQEVVNFGMLYYYGKHQSRFNPFLGLTGFNLTKPKETFIGSQNRLPRRYYMNTGVRVNVSELFYFIPKILIYGQAKNVQQTYGLDAGYYFKGEKFYALGGFIYRVKDANILYVGIKKDNLMFKFAYDFNISTLRGISKTRGAYEISITYYGKKVKNNEIKNCPRL